MNVCFYAPIKNEERYLEKFVRHHSKDMTENDCFVFTDTGSTDNTLNIIKKLQNEGFNIQLHLYSYEQWDFSAARNQASIKIPEYIDVCIALDIDEFFKSNWRNKIETIYEKEKHFVLSFKRTEDCSEEKEGFFFVQPRCSVHTRKDASWKFPVHECLIPKNNCVKHIVDMSLESIHYRNGKRKRNYLQIIENCIQSLENSPINPIYNQEDFLHIQYLYANELFFARQFEDALKEYGKYFKQTGLINTDTYNEEFLRNLTRCYSRVGFIYEKLTNYHSAFIYKGLAVGIWPCRETYLSLCIIHLQLGNTYEAQKYFELGLNCSQSESYEIMSNYWNLEWLEKLKATINNQPRG